MENFALCSPKELNIAIRGQWAVAVGGTIGCFTESGINFFFLPLDNILIIYILEI